MRHGFNSRKDRPDAEPAVWAGATFVLWQGQQQMARNNAHLYPSHLGGVRAGRGLWAIVVCVSFATGYLRLFCDEHQGLPSSWWRRTRRPDPRRELSGCSTVNGHCDQRLKRSYASRAPTALGALGARGMRSLAPAIRGVWRGGGFFLVLVVSAVTCRSASRSYSVSQLSRCDGADMALQRDDDLPTDCLRLPLELTPVPSSGASGALLCSVPGCHRCWLSRVKHIVRRRA
jgi:hypothetical protein